MRKARINPCERKGELVTSGEPNPNRRGPNLRYAPCECIKRLASVSGNGPLCYAMEVPSGATRVVKGARGLPPDQLLTRPCLETFRYRDSQGTRAYQNIVGERTRFSGCQDAEEDLLSEGLVRLWPTEPETLESGEFFENVAPEEVQERAIPFSPGTFNLFQRNADFLQEAQLEEKGWHVHRSANSRRISVGSSMADLLRPAPANLRQAKARRLVEEGHFLWNDKLNMVATLVAKNITEWDLISKFAPGLSREEFKHYEGQVHYEIRKHYTQRERKFAQFLESLTPLQREAADLVYLKNPDGRSRWQIAEELGISVDSLTDRINAVKRKLASAFPEFRRRKKSSKGHGRYSALKKQTMVKVTVIDPKSGERRQIQVEKSARERWKARKGADRARIRYWARIHCPIPYVH